MTLKTLFTVDIDLLPLYAIFLLIAIIVIIKGVISYKRNRIAFFSNNSKEVIGKYCNSNEEESFIYSINPSTGLPMNNDLFDAGGSAYGINDSKDIYDK